MLDVSCFRVALTGRPDTVGSGSNKVGNTGCKQHSHDDASAAWCTKKCRGDCVSSPNASSCENSVTDTNGPEKASRKACTARCAPALPVAERSISGTEARYDSPDGVVKFRLPCTASRLLQPSSNFSGGLLRARAFCNRVLYLVMTSLLHSGRQMVALSPFLFCFVD